MKRIVTALVIATSLATAAPVVAQDQSAGMTMEVALSMLELTAERTLRMHGITDVNVMNLTLSQLAGIRFATQSDDDRANRRERLLQIVTN